MSETQKPKTPRIPRKPKLWEAILSFLFLIVVMAVGIAVYGSDPHVPMLFGTAFVALVALWIGFSWKQIEEGMFNGICAALQAVVILCVIGVLIGVWLLGGVVPTMIYYGLLVMSPSIFLVAALIICSVTSLATGTSWGTAGTIGIALIGVASGLGIPLPIAAGAVISGAYFGDKMSPLSDTTNLAPAMAGTDVFTHAKYMIKPNGIAYVIVLIIYLIIGFSYRGSSGLDEIEIIKAGLRDSFIINPLFLIPPAVVILSIAFKMPAIPGIFIGVVLGMFCAFAQGANLGDIFGAGMDGFVSSTGVESIDKLLSTGGLMGMMFSVSLTILAMMFGGIMEKTGQLEVIVSRLVSHVKSTTGLVALTIGTTIVSNATMPEQYISIVVPGRMYAGTYRERGLHPKMLSNALESGGTLSSPLIPWNTCGVFLTATLGVSTFDYAPYAFLNYLVPIIVIAMTAMGKLTCRIEDDPSTVVNAIEESMPTAG